MTATTDVVDFDGLRIEYDDRVLAPRAWTSAQSRWAASLIRSAPPGPVLELCAGVGHIGLLAVSLAPRSLVAVDADPVACSFLRRNAAAAGVRVDVREAPLDSALGPSERFAVIVADPPWVASGSVAGFPEDPAFAIDGGDDGLELVRACLAQIEAHLVVAGSALLQVGPDQVPAVSALVSSMASLQVVTSRLFARGALVQVVTSRLFARGALVQVDRVLGS